jgi:hypothetical protein
MDGSGSDDRVESASRRDELDASEGADGLSECSPDSDALSLELLAARLESDPEECRKAFEGLEAIERETRLEIIAGLGRLGPESGILSLLSHLCDSGDPATRAAAVAALSQYSESASTAVGPGLAGSDLSEILVIGDQPAEPAGLPAPRRPSHTILLARDYARSWLARSLVSAIDGAGQGTIVLSASLGLERATAAFLCDVRKGVIEVLGLVEEESSRAGGLVDDIREQAGYDAIEGEPELAKGLLAGCLVLNPLPLSASVAEWLERTLGPHFQPRPVPVAGPDSARDVGSDADLARAAGMIFDACPAWIDISPLTFELAEEIVLREGQVLADPDRDSGAFRYLFEHRIIHRLELYRRMLLWMDWFWRSGGKDRLAANARIVAWQLSDEQHAVPSHPFAVELTARSLNAARRGLGTEADPRYVRQRT